MLLLTSRIQRKKRARESKERARVCCQREKKKNEKTRLFFRVGQKKKNCVAAALSLSSLSLSPAALLIEPSWATYLLLTEKEKKLSFGLPRFNERRETKKKENRFLFQPPFFFLPSPFSLSFRSLTPPPCRRRRRRMIGGFQPSIEPLALRHSWSADEALASI